MRVSRILSLSLVAAACLSLSACGFTPMHARSGPAEGLSDIRVETGDERVDFLLQEALLDRMGSRHAAGPYVLRTTTGQSAAGLGVGADAIVSRFEVRLVVSYALFREGGTDPVAQGSVTGQASYDLSRSVYASLVSEQDAEERAADMAADRLVARLVRALDDLGTP